MEEEAPQKSIILFGRDLTKIPCFRNTFIYSISSYVGFSLLTFLFTSRPAFSSHVGFASFMAVTLGYFTNCRLNKERQRREIAELLQSQEDEIFTVKSKSYIKENEPLLADA